MSYTNSLRKRLRVLDKKVKQAHLDVMECLKNKGDVSAAIQNLNNVRIDLETVKSRIKNYGKDVYLPEAQKID